VPHGPSHGGRQHRRPLGHVFHLDRALLHAPSVWDFREEVILQGPLADMIPSTDGFKMYSIGLTSIAAYLEANNYNTRIVNLAYRMLCHPAFDVARHLARLDAPCSGVRHRPALAPPYQRRPRFRPPRQRGPSGPTRRSSWRLSATWYHEELISHPDVDFVLCGDSTEEPCRQLLHALRYRMPSEEGENLA